MSAGASPQTPLGSLQRSPRLPIRLKRVASLMREGMGGEGRPRGGARGEKRGGEAGKREREGRKGGKA